MELQNKIMLITYADSMGKNINELHDILNKHYKRAVGGVHILPFFPSSADRGFAPMCYDKVDDIFGTFEDIESLGRDYYLMFDFMVNHISAQSEYFQDYLKNGDNSEYKDLFINYRDFWENGEPSPEQLDMIYKRKPRAPYIDAEFADGHKEKIWCTFCEEQIDIDVTKKKTKEFIKKTLTDMCDHGAAVIRLDAFAYAIKKPDTSCFFIEPDIWELLHEIEDTVKEKNVEILPEIHEHYKIPMKISEKGFWIYDFALPVLVLHALYNHTGEYLKKWLEMCPMKQFTTLDTHDGIGIVDVKDLLPDEEIEKVKEQMYSQGANVKKIYSSESYNNLDVYQVNTTYYSALGNNDKAYILARAIQFFAPGIPQVYYVGMLAGSNDIELMEKTKNGRDINRHYYSGHDVDNEQTRWVVSEIKKLMELRNEHPAFNLEGNISITSENNILTITRTYKKTYALGALDMFECLYDINNIRLVIFQPRLENTGSWEISKADLLSWAENTLKPTAQLAYNGEGEFCAGDHCRFCRAKAVCRKRAEYNLQLAQYDFEVPENLEDSEIPVILSKADELMNWVKDIKEYALSQALSGVHYSGYKLVEGRSNRRYTDKDAVAKAVTDDGKNPYSEPEVLGITAMEKLLGKKRFNELLGKYIEKPKGAPTLVPDSDRRPEYNSADDDFNTPVGLYVTGWVNKSDI